MPTIVTPDKPITGDLTPEQIADLIDQAATLIYNEGLMVGELWASSLEPYEPGKQCCTVGALAVVSGFRDADDVEEVFTGNVPRFDPEVGADVALDPHPVFAAVMAELGFKQPEDLYDWSDSEQDRIVVEELRAAAAAIRARGAVAS